MDLNRREFLSYSAISGSALLFNEIAAYSKPLKSFTALPGFELLILATNWGYEGTWDQFCSKIKALGYDGAEAWYPGDEKKTKGIPVVVRISQSKVRFLVDLPKATHAHYTNAKYPA